MGAQRKPVVELETRPAGPAHAVVKLVGGRANSYRRSPCEGCPWLVANNGDFPAESFRISAHTAHDCAMETFACHESGKRNPATCAGFLLRNAVHNLAVRIRQRSGDLNLDEVSEGNEELHESYRDMAIANGVPADDPAIARCRANWE